jgi:hypothetical protein
MPTEKKKDIWAALLAVQSNVGPAKKDSQNQHLRNKYASLEAVWEAVHPALQAAEVVVTNGTSLDEHGYLSVCTSLYHVPSATHIENTITMPVPKKDAHGIGSAITYGRRYNLALMLCLTQEDDDGHAAVQRPKARQEPQKPRQDPPKKAPGKAVPDMDTVLAGWAKLKNLDREVDAVDIIKMLGRPLEDFEFKPEDTPILQDKWRSVKTHKPIEEIVEVDTLHADYDRQELRNAAADAF